MPSQKLTDAFVRNVKPPKQGQVTYFDRELCLRVSHGGTKTWRAVYYINSKPNYEPLGWYDPGSNDPKALTLAEARTRAIDVVSKAKKGELPKTRKEKQDGRIESVIENFMKREGSKKRSAPETQRIFNTYVIPQLGDKLISEVSRTDVIKLLDKVEDGGLKGKRGNKLTGGPVMADQTLAAISRLFNWYAVRDDRFASPLRKGMKRTKSKERARRRVLTDEEIRLIWPLLDQDDMFSTILRLLFLTGQRRSDIANMRRSEIDKHGVWTIPASRYKNKQDHYVPLTDAALKIINAQPIIDDSDLVFTTNGKNGFTGFSKGKRRLEAAMLKVMKQQAIDAGDDPAKVNPIPQWVIHDLRRTAKTIMSRAGVPSFISERVIGHVIGGVEETYDRHSYLNEKRDALEKLAGQLELIVNPPKANVIELKRTRRKR